MNRTKKFDCVQMKWDIQQKQREEFAGVDDAERRRILMERVVADPILGPFLRRLRAAEDVIELRQAKREEAEQPTVPLADVRKRLGLVD